MAHAARRELQNDMRFFIRAFQIEDNHNLHCRQARASAVRQVQSPGQAKCGLPSARSATAHRGANAPDRRAPAGCISALARSGAQWSRRPRICWQRVIDHAIGHRRVRVRDAQRAPRHTWRGWRRCAEAQPSTETGGPSTGSGQQRKATRIGHETFKRPQKATTRKRGPQGDHK